MPQGPGLDSYPMPLGFHEADETEAWFGELDFSSMAAPVSMEAAPPMEQYSGSSGSSTPGSDYYSASSSGDATSGSSCPSSESDTVFSHISSDDASSSGESVATGIGKHVSPGPIPADVTGAGGTKRMRRSHSPDPRMRGGGGPAFKEEQRSVSPPGSFVPAAPETSQRKRYASLGVSQVAEMLQVTPPKYTHRHKHAHTHALSYRSAQTYAHIYRIQYRAVACPNCVLRVLIARRFSHAEPGFCRDGRAAGQPGQGAGFLELRPRLQGRCVSHTPPALLPPQPCRHPLPPTLAASQSSFCSLPPHLLSSLICCPLSSMPSPCFSRRVGWHLPLCPAIASVPCAGTAQTSRAAQSRLAARLLTAPASGAGETAAQAGRK